MTRSLLRKRYGLGESAQEENFWSQVSFSRLVDSPRVPSSILSVDKTGLLTDCKAGYILYLLVGNSWKAKRRSKRMKKLIRSFCSALALMAALVLWGCAGDQTHQSTGEMMDNTAITAKVKAALIDDPEV